MSTSTSGSPLAAATGSAPHGRLPFGGLVGAELRRLWLRRFIDLLVLVYFVLLGAILIFAFFQFHNPDPARAQARYDAAIAQCEQARSESGAEQADVSAEFRQLPCREQYGSVENFSAQIDERYDIAHLLPSSVSAVGGTFAMVAFLIGATFLGADWSAKTLPGLLTWEPRRARVLLGKLVALLIGVTTLAALAQLINLGAAYLTAAERGTFEFVPGIEGGFWLAIWLQMGRAVALAALFAAVGFAVTAVLRSTAATLGLAFGYLVIGEMFLGNWRPSLTPWLVSYNVAGWLQRGGLTLEIPTIDAFGQVDYNDMRTVLISNGRGGLYLLAGTLIALILALVTFRRRDIN